ncbi:MAG: hypothetical protein NC412_03330 [Roseburia sp.]|nr:hypothetical protein [Roseburia sp.]MCM1278440.1 hypothetical protein [Robinsoniella sp.]
MNIAILTNPKQYPYHISISQMINTILTEHAHSIYLLDINSEKYDYQCLAKLNAFEPDVIITLDLAGFRFRTQSEESALNMLFTKNLNILWGNKPEYQPLLNRKISLSMLFYDASGTDYGLPLLYPNMLYYKAAKPLPVFSASNGEASPDISRDPESAAAFLEIWHDFLKEALLSEA